MLWNVLVLVVVGGEMGVNAEEAVEPVRGGGETEAKRSLMF